MNDEHFKKVCELLDTFDQGCEYVEEYNSLLHDYNGTVLYQAESQFIKKIGDEPGITITRLAKFFNKTTSACSQLMYRMKKKNLLEQRRNEHNNKEYNLYLTDAGKTLYEAHRVFETDCYKRTASMLETFSQEELDIYIRIQEKLNESFLMDVNESKELNL